MKKSIVIMLLMVSVISSAFASNTDGVNEKVSSSFNKEFSLAQDVKWETAKDIVKATFKLNEQVLFAYFSQSGELMAVTRNILSVQLPISLMAELKKDYSGCWISELFELSGANGTTYYITLENADNTLVLKSDNSRQWQTYKKVKKIID